MVKNKLSNILNIEYYLKKSEYGLIYKGDSKLYYKIICISKKHNFVFYPVGVIINYEQKY
jgi:hypothetical protein